MPRPTGPQFEPIITMGEDDRERVHKALYHGTSKQIPEGEIISPEKSARPGRNLAFATPSLSAARRFSKDDEGNLGYVYQVEPVDREDMKSTWHREMKYFSPRTTEVVSNKGFKIIRQVR